ncbi:uncharacterized protein V1513DRAFT_446682 [Lipomyces chichibuensis]|uniref:uncharacterized protein n=1 Tax=Lipomyces chichibuensis TaxID=1546026 RepID=UPI00334313EF
MAMLPRFVFSEWELVKACLSSDIVFYDFYLTSHPFTSTLWVTFGFMVITFISCHIGKKHDFTLVDKLWPFISLSCTVNYILHGYLNGNVSYRLWLILPFQTIWACHLAELFARRGGYTSGFEDHRWAKVKASMNHDPVKLLFFSIFFVSIYQPLMLINNTMPECMLWEAGSSSLDFGDYAFLSLYIGLIGFEYLCDDYQQDYQIAKAKYNETGEMTPGYRQAQLERGFCTIGPFAYSRHPAFFTEQLIWVSLYFWGAYVSGKLINWTIVGPLVFVIFVVNSSRFTELISAERYPAYKQYKLHVGMLVPLPGKIWIEPKAD